MADKLVDGETNNFGDPKKLALLEEDNHEPSQSVSPAALSLSAEPMAVDEEEEKPPSFEQPILEHELVTGDEDQQQALKRKRSSSLEEDREPKLESKDEFKGTVVPAIPAQLVYCNLKSGICYDVRMRYHCKIVTTAMDYVDPHPEDPRRIYRIYKAIAEAGLITDPTLQGAEDLGPLMKKVPVREATLEEILLVHSPAHLDFIGSTVSMSREDLIRETEKGDSIYLSNDSYLAAKLSCGGAIEICRAVVERKVNNGIAIVRPPGHHAEPGIPGGFCLFSNVAVAAKVMLKEYPETVRRILILDWDVHHGNGTQRAFLDDPRVLYISLHRHENGTFYPGTPFGGHRVVGEGAGKGYSVNVAWSHPAMGDGDYIYAFDNVVMPIAMEFDPDLVIISAGFDAAEGDVMGGCLVTPNGYGYMTHMLKSLAKGHLAVVLEGGYNLSAISKSALAVTKVLLGDPPGMPRTKVPSSYAVRDVRDVIRTHSAYWDCLKPSYHALKENLNGRPNERIDDMVRSYQAKQFYARYGLTPLPVLKNNNPGLISMEGQILALPNVHSKDTVVVIVHDTPDVWGSVDPVLGTISTRDSSVVDSSEKLIKYAVESRKFGVIDVTIPDEYDCEDNDEESYSLQLCAQETCLYLWDNYIEYFDAKNVIFLGVGKSYCGIVHLAGHREIRRRTCAIISFVDSHTSLKAIVPIIDEFTTEWFYRSSLIFTANDHIAWDQNINPRKPRRKFGRVIRSDAVGLAHVVDERFQEATEFINDALDEDEEIPDE